MVVMMEKEQQQQAQNYKQMEIQEEVMMGCSNKEQAQMIVKGKRTKRQRPQSPIPFRIPPANSSKSDEGSSDICSNIQDTNTNTNNVDVENNHVNSVSNALQPTSSSDEYNYRDSTTDREEEEDMANCLILLAQGQSRHQSLSPKHQHQLLHHHQQQQAGQGQEIGQKFNSRKFMETGTASGSGKAGYYVYECKTCSKTFPSFQALGGHRASHKKPKVKEENKRQAKFLLSEDEDSQYISSSLSLQLNNRGLFNHNNHGSNSNHNKPRVHECSICGAEFSSGQALGGHMRRHRAPVGGGGSQATPTTTTLSLTPTMNAEAEHVDHHHHQLEETRVVVPSMSPSSAAKNNVLSLDLDLNLPAPEDDHRESKFHFASKQPQEPPPPPPPTQQQQQQPPQQLVFSPPTLVGCHY
ncbi:hypothetical protein Ancab_023590 [Ancistrocladus abbreviatus]